MAYDKVVDSAKLDLAMKATADGIRETTNYSEDITWDEERGFADPVIGLVSGAVSNARSEGYNEGVPVGKKEEYEAFWYSAVDGDFSNVEATYRFAGACWNDETFKPPKKITVKGTCNYCFYNNKSTDITPYVEFADVSSLNATFNYSSTKKIPNIDASNVTTLSSTFANSQVETIEGLTVSESTKFSYSFSGASKLVSITFYGTIAQNGLSFSNSHLLDKESIESIINSLSTSTSGLSVTISKSSVNKAFETASGANDGSKSDEWLALVATRSNWTISLV